MSTDWRAGGRNHGRQRIGRLLALLLILPAAGFAARPWPDTSARIVPFADQLPDGLTEAQRRFAATHFAGTQKMRRSELRALRVFNAEFLCLHYQLAVGAGPAEFIVGDSWGSDWAFVDSQPDWFLLEPGGRRVHQTQWNWDVMDVRYAGGVPVSGFPAYWMGTCLDRIRATESDGVFADSYTPDGYGFGQSTPPHPWLEDVDLCRANWVPSLEQFGAAARDALAAAGFKFLPNLGGLVTGWLDMDYGIGHGGMIECFAFWGPDNYFDPADWRLQLERALALARRDKIVICQSYPGENNARERMFATASYLLVKGSKTYLNLLASSDVALEYYPEYTLDLGAAPGGIPAGVDDLWNADWGVFRRDFANGIVVVNPTDAAVEIPDLGGTFWRAVASGGGVVDENGNHGGALATVATASLTLPARSGAVLLRSATTGGGSPAGSVLSVSPARRVCGPAGGRVTFTVANPGGGRMIYRASKTASWMDILRGTGTNRGTVVVACLPNPRAGARSGWVTIRAAGAAGSPKRVKVVQGGRRIPLLQVTPEIRHRSSSRGQTTFTVLNKGGGTLRYRAREWVPWLWISRGARGTNRQTLEITCSRNLSSQTRTGTVRVAASGANFSPVRVKIVQAGAP